MRVVSCQHEKGTERWATPRGGFGFGGVRKNRQDPSHHHGHHHSHNRRHPLGHQIPGPSERGDGVQMKRVTSHLCLQF